MAMALNYAIVIVHDRQPKHYVAVPEEIIGGSVTNSSSETTTAHEEESSINGRTAAFSS